ncbi:hypothetical protein PybrP1_008697 [[Pythium] brassicae (nom. inval.)]|nr:hypothetical protein PybrP1_008697 [[Pythium] brassicae (nom. inval.)]
MTMITKSCCYDVVLLPNTCSRSSSSLRATELSTVSSCSSASECGAAARLQDWMYWQRDGDKNPSCWTKVFAVLRDEFLWLYQRQESAPKSVLLQLAVMTVEVSGERQLRVVDPNGEDITLCLLSTDAFESWREGLQLASVRTDEYFRSSNLDAKHLPDDSFFRGTLVAYRQPTKRQRCMTAVSRLAHRLKD